MIYTVTFNPSIDYFATVDHFKAGCVNRTVNEVLFPGGKGINVSIMLKNLGMESTALGFVAGFTGEEIRKLITEYQINTEFIEVKNGISRINVKLRSEQETEINGMGPKPDEEALSSFWNIVDKLVAGDMLILAGSIPNSLPDTMYKDILGRTSNKGIRVVVDATKDLLVNVLEYKPFLVKPNNYELGEIFGIENLTDKEEVVKYAKKLQEMGAANVLVSMAGDGAVLVSEDGSVYKKEAPKGTVKNSVGAGDSMVAGFMYGYINTESFEKALDFGICAGSASAFSDNFASKEEVMRIYETYLLQNSAEHAVDK